MGEDANIMYVAKRQSKPTRVAYGPASLSQISLISSLPSRERDKPQMGGWFVGCSVITNGRPLLILVLRVSYLYYRWYCVIYYLCAGVR